MESRQIAVTLWKQYKLKSSLFFSHLISPSNDYSEWPLLSRTVCTRGAQQTIQIFLFSNMMMIWGSSSVAKGNETHRVHLGVLCIDECVGMASCVCVGVKLVLKFLIEEEHCGVSVEFPWGVPHPKSDGTAQRRYQIRSKSVECRWDL